ncbi:MAG: Zn-dependent alcohol dehydrogenase, partial [Acidimicrobiia bacterium]
MRAVKRTPEGIECVEVPDASGDGVPVRVVAAGICGTDVTMASMGPLPVVLGHEVAGVLADGTQVAIEPVVPCGACDTCTRGDYQLCRRLQIVGITRDGGMAEWVVVPSRCLVPLPGNLDVRDA